MQTFKRDGLSMKKTSRQKYKINFCKCPENRASFLEKGAVGLIQNLEKKR